MHCDARRRALARLLWPLLALALALPAAPAAAQAGPAQVGCAADGTHVAALLRAVRAANSDPDADTIALSPGCTYGFAAAQDLESASALPRISAPLTIEGNGATIRRSAIAGASPFRLISAEADLTLRDLTLTGGLAPDGEDGGAVLARPGAALRLERIRAANNRSRDGGAIFTRGPLSVTQSTFNNNEAEDGGAIVAMGPATIADSRFRSNSAEGVGGSLFFGAAGALVVRSSTFILGGAESGAGIYALGPSTISGSVFNTNLASSMGGAIVSTAPLTIIDSALVFNLAAGDGEAPQPQGQATGGAIVAGDTLVIERSQLMQNGADTNAAAILLLGSASGPSRIANSLIVENQVAAEVGRASVCLFCGEADGDIKITHSTLVAADANSHVGLRLAKGTARVESSILTGFQTAAQRTGDGTLTVRRNLLYANQVNHQGVIDAGGSVVGQEPLFADAGRGDYRLLPGSPALGRATPGLAALDLRGVHRPQGGAPDIGAYELDEGAIPAGRSYRVACEADALAEAIDAVNAEPGADRLELAAGCAYAIEEPIAPGLGLPLVSDYLEIVGNGASIRPAAGAPPMELLRAVDATLHLSDLTVADAVSEDSALSFDEASNIGVDDDLTLTEVTLRDNQTSDGALYFYGASLRVEESRFERNQASGDGGALHVSGGTIEISNSAFQGNRAADGGAIYSGGSLALRASEFVGNQAEEEGGAIYHDAGSFVVEASGFRGNGAGQSGGAIYHDAMVSMEVRGSTFAANSAPRGGALYAHTLGSLLLESNLWHDHPQASAGEAVVWLAQNTEEMAEAALLHNSFGAATAAPGAAIRSEGIAAFRASGNIIAGHQRGLVVDAAVAPSAVQNLFWQAPVVGEGRAADPLFVSPAAGDYRLRAGSPAIDAVAASETTRDLAGTARPQGEAYDQGAYEYVPGAAEQPAPQPGQPAPQPGQPGATPYRLHLPLLRR